MYKHYLLALFCVLPAVVLPGCGALKPSPAWSAASSLKLPGRGDYDQSQAYAKGAARELAQRGIPNRLVTFRYTVADEKNNPKVFTRSAVIYRDDTRVDYPWWLVDNMVRLPVWLPNASVAEQVHSVTRYEPEILDVTEQTPCVVQTQGTCQPVAAVVNRTALFYKLNGTPYDPSSSMDKRKMAALCDCLSR